MFITLGSGGVWVRHFVMYNRRSMASKMFAVRRGPSLSAFEKFGWIGRFLLLVDVNLTTCISTGPKGPGIDVCDHDEAILLLTSGDKGRRLSTSDANIYLVAGLTELISTPGLATKAEPISALLPRSLWTETLQITMYFWRNCLAAHH